MNLHGLAAGMVAVVNPLVQCQVQSSTGRTTNSDGSIVPTYASPITLPAQVQPLSQKDLAQADSLNLQGTLRAIYLNGNVDGTVRVALRGGDLIDVSSGPNAGRYLVTSVEEAWPDWTRAIVTLQDGS